MGWLNSGWVDNNGDGLERRRGAIYSSEGTGPSQFSIYKEKVWSLAEKFAEELDKNFISILTYRQSWWYDEIEEVISVVNIHWLHYEHSGRLAKGNNGKAKNLIDPRKARNWANKVDLVSVFVAERFDLDLPESKVIPAIEARERENVCEENNRIFKKTVNDFIGSEVKDFTEDDVKEVVRKAYESRVTTFSTEDPYSWRREILNVAKDSKKQKTEDEKKEIIDGFYKWAIKFLKENIHENLEKIASKEFELYTVGKTTLLSSTIMIENSANKKLQEDYDHLADLSLASEFDELMVKAKKILEQEKDVMRIHADVGDFLARKTDKVWKVRVPENLKGRFIGKKGKNIRRLKDRLWKENAMDVDIIVL